MPKIGIMGGTFNPVHNAHIELAQKALTQFGLDKVLFITSGNPPHKKNSIIPDATLRHKMVSLAIEDYPQFEAYDYEVKKQTYSYSYETLKHLKHLNRENELYFIIGADSLHNITSWVKPRLIMEMCTLLVYSRKGYDMEKDLRELKKEYYMKAQFIDAPEIDISSSNIRNMIAEGKDVSGFMPPKALDFISRTMLYKKKASSMKKQLKKLLSRDRFIHSVNVCNTASALAKRFGFDENKAYIAGLLHDCAKCIPHELTLKLCDDFDVLLDEYDEQIPALIHSKLGEKLASSYFGISDSEILEAIKWHTLGHPDMGNIAKIVYVSDMIEPSRCFEGIERLRDIAKENLDRAVYECTNATIIFNTQRNRKINPMAYEVLKAFSPKENEQS